MDRNPYSAQAAPSDVGAYAEVFDHLRARALGPDESRTLIAQVADEML
jgi:hypothetical protein